MYPERLIKLILPEFFCVINKKVTALHPVLTVTLRYVFLRSSGGSYTYTNVVSRSVNKKAIEYKRG